MHDLIHQGALMLGMRMTQNGNPSLITHPRHLKQSFNLPGRPVNRQCISAWRCTAHPTCSQILIAANCKD